jgi:uncharacterized protein
MSQPNLYILAADNPSAVLSHLRSDASRASNQDEHGYSLLHAAASYGHIELLRALVQEFHVDPNLTDEDDETCLFVTEQLDIAKCLVEELGIDANHRNAEGFTAQEMIEGEGSFLDIATYLGEVTGNTISEERQQALRDVHPPPPLPSNISVNVGTMSQQEVDGEAGEVDAEFRRRIAELAAREDFHTEAGQNQLRALVTDAIRGVGAHTQDRDVRRRTE